MGLFLEVFENFKKFKVLIEIESGLSVKAMRSDRGGEFTSNKFNKYCEDHGICRPPLCQDHLNKME